VSSVIILCYSRAKAEGPPPQPLVDLEYEDWWMQHERGCDTAPPPAGEYLELPAGGNFTVELAGNLAFSSMRKSPPGVIARFGDGKNHTLPYDVHNGAPTSVNGCISSPNLHAQNESKAYGSAFAISYNSNISDVTMDNLVVFTVRKNTPFYRLATFDVPADLPACPEEGCHCTWLWIADGCGQDNMYMQPLKCMVTNATSTRKVAKAKTPVYCKEDRSKCVKGAKSMVAWKQKSGNNYERKQGEDRPGYNTVLGFRDGAQNDIFEDEDSANSTAPEPTSTEVGDIAEGLMPLATMQPGVRRRKLLVFQ
jgi:hypothetical protein